MQLKEAGKLGEAKRALKDVELTSDMEQEDIEKVCKGVEREKV